jgi:hypothetical protein
MIHKMKTPKNDIFSGYGETVLYAVGSIIMLILLYLQYQN